MDLSKTKKAMILFIGSLLLAITVLCGFTLTQRNNREFVARADVTSTSDYLNYDSNGYTIYGYNSFDSLSSYSSLPFDCFFPSQLVSYRGGFDYYSLDISFDLSSSHLPTKPRAYFSVMDNGSVLSYSHLVSIEYVYCATIYSYGDDGSLGVEYSGQPIIEFMVTKYSASIPSNNRTLFLNKNLDRIDRCYYIIGGYTYDIVPLPTFYRISKDDVLKFCTNEPVSSLTPKPFNGRDVQLLYNFGRTVYHFSATALTRLLEFDVGGINLLSLFFGTGFIIYVGWVILKFTIPL